MPDIGKRIKKRREELGMTQEELAFKLNYKSKTTIAKIENGTNDIVQSKVVEFAKALQTSPAYLMGWIDLANELKPTEEELQRMKNAVYSEDQKNPPHSNHEMDSEYMKMVSRIMKLSPERQKQAEDYIDFLLSQQQKDKD